MDQAIGEVAQVVLVAAGTNISLFIKISLGPPSNRSEQCKRSDVKLPSVNEKGVVDIALDDAGTFWVDLV